MFELFMIVLVYALATVAFRYRDKKREERFQREVSSIYHKYGQKDLEE